MLTPRSNDLWNRLKTGTLWLGIALAIGRVGGSAPTPSSTPPAAPATEDPSERALREELDPSPSPEVMKLVLAVDESRRRSAQLLRQLEEIADDGAQKDPDRRAAIHALAALREPRGYALLAEHVALDLRLPAELSDDAQARGQPCRYALRNSPDWNVIPAVLRELERERSASETLFSAGILQDKLGVTVARAILNDRLASAKNEQHAKNLRAVLEHIH